MRRGEWRLDRGRTSRVTAVAAAVPTPLAIFGANTLVWLHSRAGLSVSTWADQSGNGYDATQATGSLQPVLNASDARLNGVPSLTFDGVDDYMSNAVVNLSPLPITIIMVLVAETWTSADVFFASNSLSAGLTVRQAVGTPQFTMLNTTSANTNTRALGSGVRIQAEFTNSVADRLLAGANSVTGANAGANTATGYRIARAGGAAAAYGNISVAEFIILNVVPTVGQNTQLDTYFSSVYGTGPIT